MEIKVSRIYVFPSGSRIDLKKVIMIGAIDKDIISNQIFVSIYTDKNSNPIIYPLGYSIGKVDPDQKARILALWSSFVQEWEQYILQEEKAP